MDKETKDSVFKGLYLQHYKELERYCRAMFPDDDLAKDLLSETISKAYQNFERIKDVNSFKAYVFGICRNLFKKHIRDRKYFENLAIAEHIPAEMPGDKAEIDRLYKALAMLDDKQREIITLFELTGFKLQEIADMLEMPVNTVKTHLSRGKEKLRLILKEENISTSKT